MQTNLQTYLRTLAIFGILIIMFAGCVAIKKGIVSKDINRLIKKSEVFQNQFTGFALYDPESEEFIARYNSHLYFTPASNTKILTTLACIEAFKDSIPSLIYMESGGTAYIEPLGDPTLLHPDFPQQPVIDKLKGKRLFVRFPEDEITPFGPGWAWDDYEYDFQTERAWLPLYGNEVRIYNDDSLHIIPDFFEDYISVNIGLKSGSRVYRERKFNLFNIWMESKTAAFERKIPFDYSRELALTLLSDTLKSAVFEVNELPDIPADTLYNQDFLPVLATMMHRSDNFLAEQLLILAARQAGFTSLTLFRNYKLDAWDFLPSPVQWVDGSGLSRYNLITPASLVSILNEIYNTLEWSYIQGVFPTGGETGTIKNWYHGNPSYIFAKTGTLSNNHCLSGFLRAKSGKIYIFSLMNNHYTRPTSEVKLEMQKFLENVRDAL